MKQTLIKIFSALCIFAALLLVWLAIVRIFNIPPFMLPTPARVAHAAMARLPSLLTSFWITGSAAAGGLAASVIVGVLIALVFAQSRWIRRMFYPYTILLQTVPIVAVAPLILMWVGPGLFSVTLIAFIICLAPIIANTTQGMISVDRNLVDLMLMNNASQAQILLKLRLPHALPALFTGSSRVGVGGIGYAIQYASAQLETDYLFALVAGATALGFSFFFAVMFLEWYFLHKWHESARNSDGD
jgi:NitT/TauT family transport system permease protein